jgi:hypothetical protein
MDIIDTASNTITSSSVIEESMDHILTLQISLLVHMLTLLTYSNNTLDFNTMSQSLIGDAR